MELVFLESQRVKMPNGAQDFQPGETVTLPDKVALRLMELVPGKVRAVEALTRIQSGVWIEFFSPLFGMCTARIHEVRVDVCIITNHSVLKGEGEPVTIPASWICGIYREQWAS